MKEEIKQICEAFNLGTLESLKTIREVVGYKETEFKTNKGSYKHYLKLKK